MRWISIQCTLFWWIKQSFPCLWTVERETLTFLSQKYQYLSPFSFQIRQGAGWWDRDVPPGRSADRCPSGPDVHLGRLGASRGSVSPGQWGQSGDDPYGRHPRPLRPGAEVPAAVHRRRAILSTPALIRECAGAFYKSMKVPGGRDSDIWLSSHVPVPIPGTRNGAYERCLH